jgi:outer membrane receptor protein involved in Fe transport
MRRVCFIVVAFLSLFQASEAGTHGSIEGFVRDKSSNETLIGVNVVVVGLSLGATSNASGFYSIANLPAGTYEIRFSLIGYRAVAMRDVRVSPDLKTRLSVELEQAAVEMQPVQIVAERPPIQKDVTGTLHTASSETFTLLPVSNISDVIGMQPGTTLENNIRGGKTTEVVYLVDGLPIQNMIEGGAATELPQSAIAEVAVQTGGFEPEYGNALSGVVNVITPRAGDEHRASLRVDKDDLFGGEQVDHRNELDVIASGPLATSLSYVASVNAIHSDTRWWQDLSRFFSSPITKTHSGLAKMEYQASTLRLTAQLLYSNRRWRDYEFTWRFNLDGLPQRKQEAWRVAAFISHSCSQSFFYNASLSRYVVNSSIGEGSPDGVDTTMYQWDFFLRYVVAGSRSWSAGQKQINNLLKADITWRFDEHHTFKFGGELNAQEIFSNVVRFEPVVNIFGKPFVNKPLLNYSTDYRYFPRSGSAYVQDRIELSKEGMLLNLGFRYDFLDPRAERPVAERVPDQRNQFATRIVATVPASIKHLFSPRIGFAAPFAERGYLFINYGVYYQFPLFDYLYSGLNNMSLKKGVGVLVGNPDLKPERTRAWEFSIKYALPSDIVLSTTYFHKETTNLIDVKTFVPTNARVAGDYGFAEFVNNPFARASGIELMIASERNKALNGSISYTFMSAEGISENARGGLQYYQWGIPVPARLFPLSWDQRHTVKLIASAELPWNIFFSATWTYHSGRPYTYYPSKDGFTPDDPSLDFEPNNARMDAFSLLNMKASKLVSIGASDTPWMNLRLYAEARNILNTKNVRWIDSGGRVGGELGDLTAWWPSRRIRIGVRVEL